MNFSLFGSSFFKKFQAFSLAGESNRNGEEESNISLNLISFREFRTTGIQIFLKERKFSFQGFEDQREEGFLLGIDIAPRTNQDSHG